MLHISQMFDPQIIDDAEHDQALQHPHILDLYLFFFLLIESLGWLIEPLRYLLWLEWSQLFNVQFAGKGKDGSHFTE